MDINIGRIQLVCNRYGLDYNEALCGSNVVVVPGSVKNIYVSFDKEGNVVDVRRHFAITKICIVKSMLFYKWKCC